MPFGDLLRVLWARKILILTIAFTVIALGLAVCLFFPKKYTAVAQVLYDGKSPDPVLGLLIPGMPGYMSTQLDIAQSQRVAQKVVEKLKLNEVPDLRNDWLKVTDGTGDLNYWLADRLLKQLDIRPTRESNVMALSYSSPDPGFSALVANAFAQAYVDTSVEIRVNNAKQGSHFFNERVRAAKEVLDAAQAKLSKYQRENGIIATDERIDSENQRLTELITQYTVIQGVAGESRSRESAASKRNIETLDEVQNSPLIQGLKVELARAESRAQETATRLGTSHPQYRSAKAEITTLQSRLDSEIGKIVRSINTTGAVNAQREAQAKAAVDAQRNKVLQLKAQRDQVLSLQQDVEAAQKDFEMISNRLAQTNLESHANQSNVSILTPASAPFRAASPNAFLIMPSAIFFGFLLATACAIIAEIRRPRLRAAEDMARELGLPVLVSIPPISSKSASLALPLDLKGLSGA